MSSLLAEKVPESIRRRVIQRPDAFRRIAKLDDDALDSLMAMFEGKPPEGKPPPGAHNRG